MTAARLIATFFGSGLLRPAPGTWGSLAAVLAALVVVRLQGPVPFVVLTVALYPLGLWATRAETAGKADHDPGEIVIDEVLGQWIALWPVVLGAWWTGADPLDLWPGWIAAFVLFRAFDILKPGPVGRADARGDAEGVMLDDVWAGILAAFGVIALGALAHLPVLL